MADEPQKRQYQVDLYQSHWSRSKTESFQIEAANAKEAEGRAAAIAKEKGLTENFDFEYTDLTSIAEEKAKAEAEAKAAQEAAEQGGDNSGEAASSDQATS